MVSIEQTEWTKEKLNENCAIEYTSDAWRIRCPFCGDSSKKSNLKRGNFYLTSGNYFCFNCQKSCDSFALVAELESKDYAVIKAAYFKHESTGGGTFEFIDGIAPEPEPEQESFVVPSNWILPEGEVLEYIESRRLNQAPNLSGELKLYYNTLNQRLVIPWIENGKITYYQERAIKDGVQPKYRFPKGSTKPIYGVDEIDNDYPYIFTLEGALDSIWVKNGVALGSITATVAQKEILSNYFTHEIVYFPDNPWVDKAAKEQIIKLSESHRDLKIWMWPKEIDAKDVNEAVCRIGVNNFFYHDDLHKYIVSVQKARCILELHS